MIIKITDPDCYQLVSKKVILHVSTTTATESITTTATESKDFKPEMIL